jgi:hypothetical protein
MGIAGLKPRHQRLAHIQLQPGHDEFH